MLAAGILLPLSAQTEPVTIMPDGSVAAPAKTKVKKAVKNEVFNPNANLSPEEAIKLLNTKHSVEMKWIEEQRKQAEAFTKRANEQFMEFAKTAGVSDLPSDALSVWLAKEDDFENKNKEQVKEIQKLFKKNPVQAQEQFTALCKQEGLEKVAQVPMLLAKLKKSNPEGLKEIKLFLEFAETTTEFADANFLRLAKYEGLSQLPEMKRVAWKSKKGAFKRKNQQELEAIKARKITDPNGAAQQLQELFRKEGVEPYLLPNGEIEW